MNIGGGEAADQLVRMMLSGGEVAVRLSGSALKNMLALSLALARDHKQISGKMNMSRMLRETRDLRTFPMTAEQYKQFVKLAKKQKLLYSAIHDRDDRGKFIDVVMPATELDRANPILERVLRVPQQEQREAPERGQREQPRQAPQRQESQREAQRETQEQEGRQRPPDGPSRPPGVPTKANTRFRGERTSSGMSELLADSAKSERYGACEDEVVIAQSRRVDGRPKTVSRSGPASPGTRASSDTSRAGTTRTMSERPSVEGRLKGYREQLDRQSRQTPVKQKSRKKVIKKELTK